jgi:hypothetical protein
MAVEEKDIELGGEVVDDALVSKLTRAELDTQIHTAKSFPRSIARFTREAKEMVMANDDVAEECVYAIPREGETIEGPSARFAEIVASSWGNCRAGARVLDMEGDFVRAQGVFLDLERNVAITYEVQRRITNKRGQRYSPDMIAVTANAACSIALRNAVLKGVPKVFWSPAYEAALSTIAGTSETLAAKRKAALDYLESKHGVSKDRVLARLGIEGVEDLTTEHLKVLRGTITAIKEKDTTAKQAFPEVGAEAEKAEAEKHGRSGAAAVAAAAKAKPSLPLEAAQAGPVEASGDPIKLPFDQGVRAMCSRCTSESEYVVMGVPYCTSHLPAKKEVSS